ncbi:hypothetical protein [Winogradskyella pulchriflava]|uniref:Uncharacterized protein n=1 Tax=Winogradskyella pulchriflava TaxID=1110688 RepID=A0ABV6QBC3_9FLAO
MLKFKFLPKFSILIALTFIVFTIIGTLSHEFGHIGVAKYFDYDTTLDYGSMNYFQKGYLEDEDLKKVNKLLENYDYKDYDNWPENIKLKFEALSLALNEKYPPLKDNHVLAIAIGGPAQTILTSFVGLLILYMRRKQHKFGFKIIDWLAIILSLFIFRPAFNFFTGLYSAIMYSNTNFNGDEFRISKLLGFNEWFIPSIALILGLIISLYVIFKIIPLKYRFSFLVSGFIGGILGYSIWFGFLGSAIFNTIICL